ncbi:HHL107Wp [Eremothecium sinecaudum]|uniref:HHL107Wp n=1 Tax=Eremothecium sinecaudum TaxID=45286 RepID=A0A109V0D2_9SACH|nr:HHL107Wp [Eremothecium sinecaudum]AMD22663.1 HHL107Wp [Eremothecium sinecaudum]
MDEFDSVARSLSSIRLLDNETWLTRRTTLPNSINMTKAAIQVESSYLYPGIVKGYLSPLNCTEMNGIINNRRAVGLIVEGHKEAGRLKDSKMRRFFNGLRQDKESNNATKFLFVVTVSPKVPVAELSLASWWLSLMANKSDYAERKRFLEMLNNDQLIETYKSTFDKPLEQFHFLLNLNTPTQLGNIAKTRDILRSVSEHTGVCFNILDNTLMNFVSDIPSLVVVDSRSPDISIKMASGMPTCVAVRCKCASELYRSIKLLEEMSNPSVYPTISQEGMPICVHTTGNQDGLLCVDYSTEIEDEVLRLLARGITLPKILLKIGINDIAGFCQSWTDSMLRTYLVGIELECICSHFTNYIEDDMPEEYMTERKVLGNIFSGTNNNSNAGKLNWFKSIFRYPKEGSAEQPDSTMDQNFEKLLEIKENISKFSTILNLLNTTLSENYN